MRTTPWPPSSACRIACGSFWLAAPLKRYSVFGQPPCSPLCKAVSSLSLVCARRGVHSQSCMCCMSKYCRLQAQWHSDHIYIRAAIDQRVEPGSLACLPTGGTPRGTFKLQRQRAHRGHCTGQQDGSQLWLVAAGHHHICASHSLNKEVWPPVRGFCGGYR